MEFPQLLPRLDATFPLVKDVGLFLLTSGRFPTFPYSPPFVKLAKEVSCSPLFVLRQPFASVNVEDFEMCYPPPPTLFQIGNCVWFVFSLFFTPECVTSSV